MLSIILPILNPTALSIGPVTIRWYALAYIFGLVIGIFYIYYLEKDLNHFNNKKNKRKFLEDYISCLALAIILGGRIGYVLFYNLSYYIQHPIQILYLWEGGMSFHGALIACIITVFIFSYYKKFNPLSLADLSVCAAPIGLFFGRIANFINQELPGRPTDVPWAVAYSNEGVFRHPSTIYEALLEGALLFFILLLAWKIFKLYKKPGLISCLFLIFYGFFRTILEFFREPDIQIGYFFNYFTLGQIFSFLMLISGIMLLSFLLKNNASRTKLPPKKHNNKLH